MAKYAVFQMTVTDEAGNIIPAASVEVRTHTTGQPLASLFEDREGTTPAGNPIEADTDGFVRFYVRGGAYQIIASKDDFSRQWNHVAIGTAAEFDVDAFSGFDNIAAVELAIVDSSINSIRVNGGAINGDGGAALYKRVVSEPSHVGKIQSGDGAWWEIVERILRPQMFGDANADFVNALAVSAAQGGRVVGDDTTFTQIKITPFQGPNQGLIVEQDGGGANTLVGGNFTYAALGQPSFLYNSIWIDADDLEVSTGSPPYTFGLNVGLVTGGANSRGSKVALASQINHNVASSVITGADHIGFFSIGTSSASHGGTGLTALLAAGTLFSQGQVAQLAPGGTNLFIVSSAEADCGIIAPASARHRLCYSIVGTGDTQGSLINGGLDIGLEISAAGQGFEQGLAFTKLHGFPGVTTTGTLIAADALGFTVANGLDFSPLTISNKFIKGPGGLSSIDGAGQMVGTSLTINSATNSGIIVSDGTATGVFNPNNLFTHSVELGSATNHNLAFVTNNVLSGYFKSSDKSLHLGTAGISHGLLSIEGITSGVVGVVVQAAAGTYNFCLPTSAGTSGQPLLSGGGGAAAMTFGTLGAPAGGTGQASFAVGDLLYADTTTSLAKLADVATGRALMSGGVSTAPAWSAAPSFGTSVTSPFFNATTVGTGYQINGTAALYIQGGVYTTLNDPSGNPKFFFGNATDDIAYIRNASLLFQNGAGSITYVVLSANGATVNGNIVSSHATAGVGYMTGSGGVVTQITNKATAVTINKANGAITMNNAALAAATIVSFTVNDTAVAATDLIMAMHESGGTLGSYTINARATGAGTFAIDVRNNTAGSLSEAIVIRFAVIKGVNA